MSKGSSFIDGIGIGLLLVYLCVIAFLLGSTVFGIYLAFCASILLGIVVLLTPPSGLIIGIVYIGWGKDLAYEIVRWLAS